VDNANLPFIECKDSGKITLSKKEINRTAKPDIIIRKLFLAVYSGNNSVEKPKVY